MGDIDYKKVFSEYLGGFDGRIILEIVENDEVIINSKSLILDILNSK